MPPVLALVACLVLAVPDPAAPTLRLPATVRPTRQAVDLTLVPSAASFSGRVDIDVTVAEPTSVVWLSAKGLEVSVATVSGAAATVVPGNEEVLGIRPGAPIPAGPATLHLEFTGPLPSNEDGGVYRQDEAGEWYVYTQFESTDARKAFPCFDEPGFKIPWDITLRVPEVHLAFANSPQASESVDDGMKVVRFATSKPMPTYLIAFAVGPFEVVDLGRAGRAATPLRLITPKGKAAETRWAATATPRLLLILEDYFGTPYPYEKLDSIAVIRKGGAMENPGLVTYGQNIILQKPGEETPSRQRSYASTCAHELAHMWFGDLVTMAWWDDIWLNEAFATWMARKVVDEWKPEWGGKVSRVTSASGAMGSDALTTARKVRQPIESMHDIENAFDGITYQKGAAVIGMFERHVGADAFRAGMRRYMEKHAWGNATAADFLAAIGAEAGFDVAPAFSTFLDQVGVPLLTVSCACARDAAPRLLVAQQRYVPEGSGGTSDETWDVPVCVRYPTGASSARRKDAGPAEATACTLLTQARGEIVLDQARRCPDWVLANDDQAGYYRVRYEGDLVQRLMALDDGRLALHERVGIAGDISALVDAGELPPGDLLGLVPKLAREESTHLVSAAMRIASSIDEDVIPPESMDRYARFITRTFGARARALGFQPRAGDDEDTRLLRPRLLSLVADEGRDATLRAEAAALARRWLDDRTAVEPELVDTVLDLAAIDGDRALFERLREEARKAVDRRERSRFLSAMGSFRDPEVARTALAILLTDEFDARETGRMSFSLLGAPETRDLVFDFTLQNYEALAARVPRDARGRFLRLGGAFCDEPHRKAVAEFFGPKVEDIPGGPRQLAQALERMGLCIAQSEAQRPGVVEFLRRY
jgi:alanyl aminopeptidase